MQEISETNLLQRWNPVTGQQGDSGSFLEQPILSQVFAKADCMARYLILYTCDDGTENT